MNKLKYHFLWWLVFLWTVLIWFYSYAALTWTNVPTTVNTSTPMTTTLWNNAMTNIINNVNSVQSALDAFSVQVWTVANVVTVQTRAQWTYTAPISWDGIEITPLRLSITPKRAGNKIILEWIVNGECSNDTVYTVTRNWVMLANATDWTNRWSWVNWQPYNVDTASTPDNAVVRIVDDSTLATASTYELRIRSSNRTAPNCFLNRTVNNAWADSNETSISTWIATEIWD